MAEEANRIDYTFIAQQEGSATVAYVPQCTLKSTTNKDNQACFGKNVGDVIGKSGVTIGKGFDIGQNNLYDLKNRMYLSQGMIDKLSPYLEKRKKDAVAALNKTPLVLSSTELAELNRAMKHSELKKLLNAYGTDINNTAKTAFHTLPVQAQTAIASWAFQGIYTDKPVWKSFVMQDWTKASEQLKAETLYSGRRKAEAALLDELISTTAN
ncbi:MAG: pesticin C-terminus-like muramidase [Flavobacteriales bacterium]|nr:pesticin C-terminus-like muramidase [Flavobacteriales bacterium]